MNSPEKSEMKLVRVRVNKKVDDVVKVNLDPEPISYDDLDTRLLNARQKSAGVHAIISDAWIELERDYKGGQINILMRELATLEGLLDSALRHAESVADQIKRETA